MYVRAALEATERRMMKKIRGWTRSINNAPRRVSRSSAASACDEKSRLINASLITEKKEVDKKYIYHLKSDINEKS